MGSEQGQSGAELAAQQAHSGRWPTLRISGPKLASKTTHQPCFQIKPHLHGVEAELVLGALLGAAQVGGQQHLQTGRERGASANTCCLLAASALQAIENCTALHERAGGSRHVTGADLLPWSPWQIRGSRRAMYAPNGRQEVRPARFVFAHLGAVVGKVLEGGHRGADAGVVGDLQVAIQGHLWYRSAGHDGRLMCIHVSGRRVCSQLQAARGSARGSVRVRQAPPSAPRLLPLPDSRSGPRARTPPCPPGQPWTGRPLRQECGGKGGQVSCTARCRIDARCKRALPPRGAAAASRLGGPSPPSRAALGSRGLHNCCARASASPDFLAIATTTREPAPCTSHGEGNALARPPRSAFVRPDMPRIGAQAPPEHPSRPFPTAHLGSSHALGHGSLQGVLLLGQGSGLEAGAGLHALGAASAGGLGGLGHHGGLSSDRGGHGATRSKGAKGRLWPAGRLHPVRPCCASLAPWAGRMPKHPDRGRTSVQAISRACGRAPSPWGAPRS